MFPLNAEVVEAQQLDQFDGIFTNFDDVFLKDDFFLGNT